MYFALISPEMTWLLGVDSVGVASALPEAAFVFCLSLRLLRRQTRTEGHWEVPGRRVSGKGRGTSFPGSTREKEIADFSCGSPGRDGHGEGTAV